MEAFVLKTLRRIRKESPRRFKDLRLTCDELIGALATKEKENGFQNQDNDADKYFEPLEMACESRQPRLMEIALDALHFLIEHGYLRGNKKIDFLTDDGRNAGSTNGADNNADTAADNEARLPQPGTLIDLVIETISKCSDETDDGVQLQVVKALLTAITSLHCEVHEASLLLSVRACFHIHLISKNNVNKTTAKAALTQMLSVVNQRMELNDAQRAQQQLQQQQSLEAVSKHSATDENSPNAAAVSSNGETAPTSDAASAEVTATEISSTEVAAAAAEKSSVPSSQSVNNLIFPSVFHKDAYLLFRALCKLSMKGLSEDSQWSQTDAIPLQNKILSLELILSILQNSGPAFRTGDKFIYAVRTYLCVSLLSNCTSHIAQVTGLSLQIFAVLMKYFKQHLKSELEVFISTIFLRMLESENSTYDHKYRVLEVFQSICKDPKGQVELFINYDCDLDAINLFSRIVAAFAKIAKNPSLSSSSRSVSVDFMSSNGKKALQEEHQIRLMGLEGLVFIIQSVETSAGLTAEADKLRAADAAAAAADDLAAAAIAESSDEMMAEKSIGIDTASLTAAVLEDESIHSPSSSSVKRPMSASGSDIVDVFDKKQRFQEQLETGILKFNLSPKNGLKFLAGLGHIEMTPNSVADFFHQYRDRLDKTMIGEFLGRERDYMDGFCLRVLHEYVEALDFSDMAFDLAIRHFLGGFRLPGEAQKIDRIMEKFAERYYLQNQNTFASADMAFILAFSTIMLQTNLHNPAIKEDKRMTKEQFIKQNKGISADGELSDELLVEIYDRIAAEPISINHEDKSRRMKKDDTQSSFVMFQTTTDKRRKDAFSHERKEMVRAGEALIKHNMKRQSTTFVRNETLSDEAYVKPMFEIVWPPVFGVLSQILETYEDPQLIQLCLSGFRHSILLACRLDFATARNTFINGLLKFTTLETVREMRAKNVHCIKLLMNVSLSEGDYLEESWTQVLQSISQLARLQLFANGSHTDDMFFSEASTSSTTSDSSRYFRRGSRATNGYFEKSGSSSSTDPFMKLFVGPSRAETARLVEEANAELVVRDIDPVVVDRLYLNSVYLSGDSVQHFVKSLCEVSLLELTTSSSMNSLRGKESSTDTAAPRIFSLQKLVEVADCNMFTRSRLDWANMWSVLARHFSRIGLHETATVAMFAIDSLKQLSIKFLQKEELSNFNFQRVFLKPFETIMARTKSFEIKDLILNCLDIMIRQCASNIHSGWRSIFSIFTVAACQDIADIASTAFTITEQLMRDMFHLVVSDFVELMNSLVAFSSCIHTSLALRALDLLDQCADHLAAGKVAPPSTAGTAAATADSSIKVQRSVESPSANATTATASAEESVSEDASVFRLWWPLLLGLSSGVGDSRFKVRRKALETLQSVLRKHGKIFSPQTWSVIFKGVLFPMIDSAKTDSTHQPRSAWPTEDPPASQNMLSWIATMGFPVLNTLVELYQLNREKDKVVPLLPDLITLLESCICQDVETLSKMGLNVLSTLLLATGNNNSSTAAATTAALESVSQKQADLVCARIVANVVSNVCLDFADAGAVALHFEEIPQDVKQEVSKCPLAERRRMKLGNASNRRSMTKLEDLMPPGTELATPFGVGTVEEVLAYDVALEVSARMRLSLSWGAKLFTAEASPEVSEHTNRITSYAMDSGELLAGKATTTGSPTSAAAADMLSSPLMTKEESWGQLISAAMTSMVISLDFIALMRNLIASPTYRWDLKHFQGFLRALEVSHWHAFCFNENTPLRLQLQQRGFMNKNRSDTNLSASLPHLLEQEVMSIEQILFTIFRLYCLERQHCQDTAAAVGNAAAGSGGSLFGFLDDAFVALLPFTIDQAARFAEPFIERISSIVILRYLSMEENAVRKSSSSSKHAASNGTKTASNGARGGDPVSDDDDDDDDDEEDDEHHNSGSGSNSVVYMNEFWKMRHDAYKSPVMIVLEGMMDFTHAQFEFNLSWIVPLLSRLIVCEDLEVRLCVRQIYQSFVNFFLLK